MTWHSLQYDFLGAAGLLLLLFPIIGSLFLLYRYRQNRLSAFAQPHVLDSVVEKREPIIFWLKVLLLAIAWTCGVLSLMQPKGNERYITTSPDGQVKIEKSGDSKKTLRRNPHEVIFLIDASASMGIADVSGKRRLDVAKEIIDDVIRQLKGENVSLFAFTSSTMQIVPSTLDYLFTRLMLQQIEINEGETTGTDIKLALAFVRELFFGKSSQKTKTLILLSDGGDTRLFRLSPESEEKVIDEIISPIVDAKEKHLRVFTVGLGSLKGEKIPEVTFKGQPVISQLEEPLLHQLSAEGKGEAFVVGNMTSFQIAQKLAQRIAKEESFIDPSTSPPESQNSQTHLFDLYFQIPLGIAIIALAAYLVIPNTHKKRKSWQASLFLFFLLPHSLHAQALPANAYFEAGDFENAKREYESLLDDDTPQWQRDILRYNIATAELANGQWEKAMDGLRPLLKEKNVSPILVQRSTINLVIARLMELNIRLTSLKETPQAPIHDYYEVFLLFRLALIDIDKAQEAWCTMQTFEGAKTCSPSFKLDDIRTRLNNLFQQFLDGASAYPEIQSLTLSAAIHRYIDSMVHQLEIAPTPNAKSILQNAIAKENLIILLNQLHEHLDDADQLILSLQKSALNTASQFPDSIIKEQIAAFRSENEQASHCQCHPWDEVIPLFSEGYDYASGATRGLEEDSSARGTIEAWQIKAEALWKEALHKMLSTSSQSKQKTPQQEDMPPTSQQKEEQEPQLYDILQTLQNMEQDDRSRPAFEQATSSQGDDKPW